MNSTELQQLARNAVDEMKGADIVVLDVAERTSVTDWMIVVTGTEGETDGNWILVDLGDVVVHVMTRESRDFYALEKLWGMVASERGDSDTEDSLAEDAEGAPVNQQQVQ